VKYTIDFFHLQDYYCKCFDEFFVIYGEKAGDLTYTPHPEMLGIGRNSFLRETGKHALFIYNGLGIGGIFT
jgi:hypothetical protein